MLVKLEVSKLQALVVIFLASLWSSAVHCHVLDQASDSDDVDTTDNDSDASWPVLCPEDTFFDRMQEKCTACSQCPMNQVITSPCQGLQDTQCGPFISFQHFASSGKDSDNLGPDAFDVDIESEPTVDSSNANENDDTDVKDIHTPSEVNTLESEEESLSLILVVVLVIVSIIFLLVIAITFYIRRKAAPPPTKKILCEYQAAPVPV